MEKLTRDAILKAEDLPSEIVPVPEWGGSVIVRTMRADERDAYELECYDSREASKKAGQGDHQEHIRARLAAWTIVDDGGNRIFTADDLHALGQKSARALDRVCDAARRLSGLGDKEMEDLAKNLKAEPSSDSATD